MAPESEVMRSREIGIFSRRSANLSSASGLSISAQGMTICWMSWPAHSTYMRAMRPVPPLLMAFQISGSRNALI